MTTRVGRLLRPGLSRSLVLAALAIATAWPAVSVAQPTQPYIRRTDYPVNDQRSQDVQKMLRDLLEEELRNRPEDRLDNRNLPAADPRFPQPVVPNVVGNDLTTVRRALLDFARQADDLASSLSRDVSRVPRVRDYISDVLKIRARSSILSQQVQNTQDLRTIAIDLRELDQNWRLLSFQLKALRGLSRDSTQAIARMDVDLQTFGKLMQIDPQLDRTELLRQASALSTALYTLVDDMQIELSANAEARQLIQEGRRIEQEARYLSVAATDRATYKQTVAVFNRFEEGWKPFVVKVRAFQDRYIERDVRRVQEIRASIRELLWLPEELQHEELLYLTDVLMRDVDTFFSRAPLKLLIELPRGNEVISTGDMFFGVCQNFADIARRGRDYEELIDAYSYIEDAWRDFDAVFKPMKSQAALAVLAQIEKSIMALQAELGVRDSFDRDVLLKSAAELESLSDHLEDDVRMWLDRERPSYAREAEREVTAFHRACSDLHAVLLTGADQRAIEPRVNQLMDSWRRVYGYTSRCRTADRDHLQRIAAMIMPALLDLQAHTVR